jgi:outer membrane immunogenic protein
LAPNTIGRNYSHLQSITQGASRTRSFFKEGKMRRFVVALLATSALSFAAQAADMPVKAPRAAPAPTYNWSGCYLGGHAGAGWGRTEWTNTADTTLFGDLTPGQGFTQTKAGFIGGGQAGCNYQMGTWVFGIEGTFAGSSIKGSLTNTTFGVGFDDVFETKINSLATLTGRIGYAVDNWLPYIKGGYSGANVKFSVSDTAGANQGSGSETKWHNGWTVGAGVEYGLTQNWIVGLEYDYIGLQTKNYNVTGSSAGVYTFDVKPKIHEILARISYKF